MFYGKVVVYVFPTPSEQFLRRQVDLCKAIKEPSSLLFVRRKIGYLDVKQPSTYGIQFRLFAFNYLDLSPHKCKAP